jgi:hypothetical protein
VNQNLCFHSIQTEGHNLELLPPLLPLPPPPTNAKLRPVSTKPSEQFNEIDNILIKIFYITRRMFWTAKQKSKNFYPKKQKTKKRRKQ